ncbi:unnamed protein product [Aphis gossypii]|uniref:Uncharacterized protein n=1 Tax=Aphis gossypii TaxID=80765 RepID=A0A9P0JCL6_APHGO|nr:unnamed protein product [Aphis gossypii]
MWSKYNLGEKKNIFFNHEVHFKKDIETVIQTNSNMFSRQCTVVLGPAINLDKLKKYARKAPEEFTFGLNQRYPKRRKPNDYQDGYSDYLGPFDYDHLTSKSIRNLCKYKKFCHRKLFKTSYKYSKLNPDIVIDFIKIPSIHKLTKLLDLMYNDSLHRLCSNDLGGREKKIIQMSKELKTFLFDLCYHKFLTFWGPELEFAKSKLDLFVLKEYKRLRRSYIKNARANTTVDSPNLRKFIMCNGGLIRYSKKPQIVRCFYIINTFCSILVKKSCRLIRRALMKKSRRGSNKGIRKPIFFNCVHPDIEILRLKLYHEGTTIRKTFMEIIDEYKHITKNSRLTFSQISDIRCAYERILNPGECIDKLDLEKCANENYNYECFQNGTDLNHTIIFNDLTTVNNDDFDLELDDSDIKPENVLNESDMIPNFSGFVSTTVVNQKADKLPQHIIDWVEEVRSRNYFRYKLETLNGIYIADNLNESAELIEKEVHTKFTSNEDPNIQNEKETLSHCLEEVKMSTDSLIQERTVTINQDRDIYTDSLEEKSVINYSEAETSENLEKKIPMVNLEKDISMVNSEQKNLIGVLVKKTSTNNSEEDEEVDEEVEDEEEDDDEDDDEDDFDGDINDSDDNNDDDNEGREGGREVSTINNTSEEKNICSKMSAINAYFKKILFRQSLQVYKSERKVLRRLVNGGKISRKLLAKLGLPVELFQQIIYYGGLRLAIRKELHFHHLEFISDKKYKKLLKSIKRNNSMVQQFFTFNGVVNFLIWPLGKDIVNSIIPHCSPIINTLFVFVKDVISKFCEKVKIFLRESGLTIVLNKESLFENLCNEQIRKDAFTTEQSLEYANINNPHVSEKLITGHLDLTNTSCCIKKNSSNAEICKSMINILKSDNSSLLSWEECNNFNKFKSKLLQVGLPLPIEKDNTMYGAKFIELYVRWFCEEYLRGDQFYKLAISILKNIVIQINTVDEVDMAIDNALIILYQDPCFAKVYKSYINAKNPKCLTSSKFENSSNDKNHSDYKDCNKRGIEEVNIEPVNVKTNTIDADNVEMSSVISEVSTSNVFDELNNIQVNGSEASNPQCLNYNSKNDFIHDFSKLLSENGDGASNNLFENIDVDENNLFNTGFINIDDSNCNPLQFNEANPFDDFTITKLFDDNIPLETHSVNDMLEINLQFQQDKNTEEVSLISSCDELVNYAVSDEISLEDLNMAAVSYEYGFDNAGVLSPPYN